MALQMSDKARQTVYIVMGLLYAVAVACAQQGVVPAQYAHLLGALELILASLMKEFGSTPQDGAK
jgi:hypothetical protein